MDEPVVSVDDTLALLKRLQGIAQRRMIDTKDLERLNDEMMNAQSAIVRELQRRYGWNK